MIGLTNYIISVVINKLGGIGQTKNQFDLFDPDDEDLTTITIMTRMQTDTSSHTPFTFPLNKLVPIDRDDIVAKYSTLIILNNDLLILDQGRLETLIANELLQNGGYLGKWPMILPSRDKIFR